MMKRKIAALLVLLVAGAAISFPSGYQKLKYKMLACPANAGWDENYTPNCGQPGSGTNSYCSKGTCTGAAPTSATEGLSLYQNGAFGLTACAPNYYTYAADGGTVVYTDGGPVGAPQTLDGTGAFNAYVYHAGEGAWARNPGLDFSVTVTATSCGGAPCRCQNFPDVQVGNRFDRIQYVANGVTMHLTDGGTTDAGMDILLDGWNAPPAWNY